MTCTIPLISLHRAWALINSIVNDTQLTSIVAHLASKIDKLEGQIGMSCKVNSPLHTCTGTTASQTENTVSCDYVTVTSMTKAQLFQTPNIYLRHSTKSKTLHPQIPSINQHPCHQSHCQQTLLCAHDHIIVRFIHLTAGLGFIKGFGSNVNIFKVKYVKYEGELWTNESQFFFRTS